MASDTEISLALARAAGRGGGRRKRNAGAKLISGRVEIAKRPAMVEKRNRFGDWEGDTIHGQSAHLVTRVDRKSRLTLAKRVFSKSQREVGDALIE